MTKRKRSKQTVPLIIEPHPSDYNGYPFITLLQFRQDHVLSLIDNAVNNKVKAYVLDYCVPSGINEEQLIEIAGNWYETNSCKYPLSVEFSKAGLSKSLTPIYKSFNTEYITRVIGPLPQFTMNENVTVKRRRKKPLPPELTKKVVKIYS